MPKESRPPKATIPASVKLADVAALHHAGRIRPQIAARFGFSQVAQAFAMAQDRSTVGRVILQPD